MDEGRIAGTSDIWDATQISSYQEVEAVIWECPGCTLPVFPVAWRPGRYKVTAHFRRKPGIFHSYNCQYDLVCSAGSKSIVNGKMGSPASWIDRITFPSGGNRGTMTRQQVAPIVRVPTSVGHSSIRHSIGAACKFHDVLKGQRCNWPLCVDDVDGSNYFDVFKPARSLPEKSRETRIWFSELRIMDQITVCGDEVRAVLNDQVEVADGKTSVDVRIDMNGWSSFQRVMFVDRLLEARTSAWTSKGIRPPVIYALAQRSAKMPNIISIDNPRKFSIVKRI